MLHVPDAITLEGDVLVGRGAQVLLPAGPMAIDVPTSEPVTLLRKERF